LAAIAPAEAGGGTHRLSLALVLATPLRRTPRRVARLLGT